MNWLSSSKSLVIHAPDYVLQRPFVSKTRSQWLWNLVVVGLVINDLLFTAVAFFLSFLIRHLGDNLALGLFHYTLALLLIPLWILLFGIVGLYNRRKLLNGFTEYQLVFRVISVGMLAVVFAGFMEYSPFLDRWWLFWAWGLSVFFVAAGRFLMRRVVYILRWRGYLMSAGVILGANEEGRLLAEQLHVVRASGIEVVGFLDDSRPVGSLWADLPVLGRVTDLGQLIEQFGLKEVILATSAFTRAEMLPIFRQYGVIRDLNLRLSSGLFEVITTGLEVEEIAFVPLTRVNQVRLTGMDRWLKTTLDYALAIPLLLLSLPLFALFAVLIKLDSPGPVFHRRQVLGVNGRSFFAFKFRTMFVNGEQILAQQPELQAELTQTHKLKNDPRVTRFGRFLRRFSLDELPQLWNVFRHEMSLVGPRMIALNELEEYSQWDVNLLTMCPGMTGLWQVSGRSDVSYENRVSLDMYYIRNWTIWLDMALLLRTIPAVLTARGAY